MEETIWKTASSDNFWGASTQNDHIVQIYESDQVLLDSLMDFMIKGFDEQECVIVIATKNHLNQISDAIYRSGLTESALIEDELYFPLDADLMLSYFMIDGWPDSILFEKTIETFLNKAKSRNRRVKAFGEMVALLWTKGMKGATVHLEHLWNQLALTHKFSLLCAYPRSGFTEDVQDSIRHICDCHVKVLNGSFQHSGVVIYRDLQPS